MKTVFGLSDELLWRISGASGCPVVANDYPEAVAEIEVTHIICGLEGGVGSLGTMYIILHHPRRDCVASHVA